MNIILLETTYISFKRINKSLKDSVEGGMICWDEEAQFHGKDRISNELQTLMDFDRTKRWSDGSFITEKYISRSLSLVIPYCFSVFVNHLYRSPLESTLQSFENPENIFSIFSLHAHFMNSDY